MKQTLPEQLRLAADIEQAKLDGRPVEWEYRNPHDMNSHWGVPVLSLLYYIKNDFEIRRAPLTFPDPPEGREWHNPENLTPDQVGVNDGWRLCLADETANLPDEALILGKWQCAGISNILKYKDCRSTYRTRAPLPKPAPARVPLTAADVPMGSVLKYKIGDYRAEHMVIAKNDECILIGNPSKTFSEVKYEVLFRDWLRMENGTWQPCSKPAE